MSELHFDKALHSYTYNGVRVPSVTQILQAEGFTHPYNGNTAASRGTRIHSATRAFDNMDIPVQLPEAERGYLEAYINWQKETKLDTHFVEIEKPRYNEELHFAGTPDRISENGTIYDIKTGRPEKTHGLQLAGYALLHIKEVTATRVNIYLVNDGSYDEVMQTEAGDYTVFKNALYNYHWKIARGIR